MVFNPLDSTEIEEGKPVLPSTQGKIKQNFEDHESRITQVEVRNHLPPIILRVNGPYSLFGSPQSAVIQTAITKDLLITGVRLISDQAGSDGTLTVNIRRIRGGSDESIFSTMPSLPASAGDDATSTSGVLNVFRTLEDGDLLELDIESVQTGGVGFMVRIDVARI